MYIKRAADLYDGEDVRDVIVASDELIASAGYLADRISVNLELPTEEGKDAVEMKPGDCINIPTGVKHWHGAAPDEWFSHLAIEVPGENSSNEWLELVSDEEYRKLK